MAIDIWVAGVGILLIWKLKTNYKTIKPLFIYKNKRSPNVVIPDLNMHTNTSIENSINSPSHISFIRSRSKSLPTIYESRPL